MIQSGEHTLYTKGTQPYKDLFEYTGEEASEHILVKLYGYQETQLLTHNYPYQIAVNYGVSRNFLNLYLNDTGLPFEDDPSLQLTYNDYFDGRDPRLAETALRRASTPTSSVRSCPMRSRVRVSASANTCATTA